MRAARTLELSTRKQDPVTDLPVLRPIGLALVRATEIMGAEPYFHEFIAGVERAVRPAGYSVLLNVLDRKSVV